MRIAQAGFKHGKKGKTAADLLAEVGPTFRVDIGLKSRAPASERPDLPGKQIHELIDTGAGANGIDEELAQSLGLPATDEGEMSGFHGTEPVVFYLARLYVTVLDRLLFERFAGAKLKAGGQTHRVIFGRPFLRRYRMDYNALTGQVQVEEP